MIFVHTIAVLLDLFVKHPKLAGLVGVLFAVGATALGIVWWHDYAQMPDQPQSVTMVEAAAIADSKPWVTIEDGVWNCQNIWYMGSDRTYAVLTNTSQTVVTVVLYSDKVSCNALQARQPRGILTRMAEKRYSVASREHDFSEYPDATAFLDLCGFCGADNSLGLVVMSGVAVVLGLLLYPLSLREYNKRYGAGGPT